MPDQPGTWAAILGFLQAVPLAIQGAFMAIVVAAVRIIYEDRRSSIPRKSAEALLCGFLAMASGGVLDVMGMDSRALMIPVSAIIGFLGVEEMRALARKYTRGGRDDD